MRKRLTALAVLLASWCILQPAAALAAPEDGPAEIVQGQADRNRRMTVPVRLDGQGPFHFVIDTGSQTTVISRTIATQLALRPGPRLRIMGIAGPQQAETALVGEMTLGRRTFRELVAPVFGAYDIGADGVVGIDSLQGQRVLLDFTRNLLEVGSARSLGGKTGFEIVVVARRRRGQLIMTNAVIDGVRTDVVIDTGTETSIGNRALQRALARRGEGQQIMLTGITGEVSAELGAARKLEIESIAITNLVVAYTDAPIFAALDLARRPALMLGMRELRLFRRIAIDFAARKVFFDLPPRP